MREFSTTNLLKEWAITCEALAQGRQIVLLRKGGLLDEDGTFSLESPEFLLLPTYLHQEPALVKPQHRDLWEQTQKLPDETVKNAVLRHFARVERVWLLREDAEKSLANVRHIWSQNYLDLRWTYNPEKPLLCAALRVFTLETPLRYPLRAQDMGCKSWILDAPPQNFRASAVLSDAEFGAHLAEIAAALG